MISVYPFDDELYAFGETPIIHKIDPETLNTENALDVSSYVSIINHTSHPHVMQDGTYITKKLKYINKHCNTFLMENLYFRNCLQFGYIIIWFWAISYYNLLSKNG